MAHRLHWESHLPCRWPDWVYWVQTAQPPRQAGLQSPRQIYLPADIPYSGSWHEPASQSHACTMGQACSALQAWAGALPNLSDRVRARCHCAGELKRLLSVNGNGNLPPKGLLCAECLWFVAMGSSGRPSGGCQCHLVPSSMVAAPASLGAWGKGRVATKERVQRCLWQCDSVSHLPQHVLSSPCVGAMVYRVAMMQGGRRLVLALLIFS